MPSIWLLKQHGTLPTSPGGTRQWDMAEGLASRSYDVTFIISGFDHTTKAYLKRFGEKNYLVDKFGLVNVLWIKSTAYDANNWRRGLNAVDFAFRLYLSLKNMPAKEKEIIKTPDAIIAVSLPLFAPLAAYQIAKEKHADFFIEVSDIWPQVLVDMKKIKKKSLIFKFLKTLEIYLYRKAKRIISPFPEFKSYLERYHLEDKFSWVARGLVDKNFVIPSSSNEGEIFRIVYIGAHGPANALHEVLDAFKRLKNYEIELSFFGDGIEKNNLKKLAENNKLDNIIFRDPVPKSDIFSILSTADACLLFVKALPVHKYGIFPNKLADYLWAGKPIITNKGADNGLVDRLKCGITVPPNDPEALSDAIIKLSTTPFETRRQMGISGRRYAEKYLKMDSVIDQLETALGYK
jgi:glycosyltransferase involved in cell wall biosynthesis